MNLIKTIFSNKKFKKIFIWVGIPLASIFTILLIIMIYAGYYFENNKDEIITKINTTLDNNITGDIKIRDIGYKFITSLPNFTLVLKDVELKDTFFVVHKRPLLIAKEIEVHLNIFSLLKKEVNFNRITIKNALIDLYKDKNGIKNSDIFKKKEKKPASDGDSPMDIRIKRIDLENVIFISENEMAQRKLFQFEIESLKGRIKYTDTGWEANVNLKTIAKSMAFNLENGSFMKGKRVEGILKVDFSQENKSMAVSTNRLKIGNDIFRIRGNFGTTKQNQLFDLDIRTNILWKSAAELLPNNIYKKLKKFDIADKIKVNCFVNGNMGIKGTPHIFVSAVAKKTVLKIPDGVFKECSFIGKFTNDFVKGKGYTDENSAIIISDFTGAYNEIPIVMPVTKIINLKKPIASGSLKTEFNPVKLNKIVGNPKLTFKGGVAKIDLNYVLDIVGLKINKPHFTGTVDIKDAKISLNPMKHNFEANVNLKFEENDLHIQNIAYRSKNTKMSITGKIDDFLNLYYNNPEKMVANLNLYSPSLDLKEITAFTGGKKKTPKVPRKKKSELDFEDVLQKSEVNFKARIDKITFLNFRATKAKFNAKLYNENISLTDGSFNAADGVVTFNGNLFPVANDYNIDAKVDISNADITQFLMGFDNFKIKSFQPENISGKLSLSTNISGQMTSKGNLLLNTLDGSVNYSIVNGMLTDFKPIVKIGKFVFPSRNVERITFSDIIGNMNIKGTKIYINELKVSSSVVNMDVKGIYSFDRGTYLGITIPLRNPKNSEEEKDAAKKEEQRNKGIVLHLLAVDKGDGKVKLKWGKYKD